MKSFWVVCGERTGAADMVSEIIPKTKKTVTVELVQDLLVPQPIKAQVLVSVKACSLTQIPHKLMTPQPAGASRFPLGYEISAVVLETGPDVRRFKIGDEVVGMLHPEYGSAGCATHLLISEIFLVLKPEHLSHTDSASVLRPGLQAYTALYVLGRMQKDDSVLICQGASPAGLLCIQLAHSLCSKIITTVSNGDEGEYIQSKVSFPITIIDLSSQSQAANNLCLKETGGLGVNLVVDFGVKLDESLTQHIKNSEYIEQNKRTSLGILDEERSYQFTEECYSLSQFRTEAGLTKYQIMSSLSLGGRWVTSQDNFQLDPPDTHTLFMKGASLSFLFPDLLILSGSNQGRYLHIMNNLMGKLEADTITPSKYDKLEFEALNGETILNYFNCETNSRLIISLEP